MTYNVDNIRTPDIVPHFFWMMDWDKTETSLNEDERKAWKVVGYTMTTWTNNTYTIKSFVDYNPEQQQAINDLGYEGYMWDDYPLVISYPYTLEDWNDDGSDVTVTNIDDYYEEHDWADLTKYQQELFNTLGDKECNWEEDGNCDDINIPWNDLTVAQKAAAEYLGFDEESWAIWVGTTGHGDGHDNDKVVTYKVTVVQSNGNKYAIDSVTTAPLKLVKGFTYIFDVSDSTNTGHPLSFKDESGNPLTTNVTISGTAGQSGATVTIKVQTTGTQPARYYCTTHGNNMGNTITILDTDSNNDSHGDGHSDTDSHGHDHTKHSVISGKASKKLTSLLSALKIPFSINSKGNKVVINTDKEILDLIKMLVKKN